MGATLPPLARAAAGAGRAGAARGFLEDEYRALLELPPEVGVHYLTPLGYPPEFPVGLRPALAKARRPWRTLVNEERWGAPWEEPAPAA